LFSRTVVYFQQPFGVQSAALATICPAVAVECGRVAGRNPGAVFSAGRAADFRWYVSYTPRSPAKRAGMST
jgi:hypothetical protein